MKNLLLGAGFALYVDKKDAERVILIAEHLKLEAFLAGRIEQAQKEKEVVILPKKIRYLGSTLDIR